MALSGVCELSSLLRVDDIERTELVRKKNSLELAIKQQEGRLMYEVEEHERLIGEASSTMERFSDVVSSVEFSELRLRHLCNSLSVARIRDVAIFTTDNDSAFAGCSSLEEVVARVETALNAATDVNASGLTHQLQCAQNNMIRLIDEHDKVAQESLCVDHDLVRGKEIIGNLDEQTADLTAQAEVSQRQLEQTCSELCSSESARDEVGEIVHRLRDDIRKLEFHNSAELGKQAQVIAQTQEKFCAEEETISNIEHEVAALGVLDRAVKAGLEEATRLESELTATIRSTEESLLTQRTEVSEITVATARLLSETLSIQNLITASSVQSFQGRADALLEDIANMERSTVQMREEISLTLQQIEQRAPHEQIQALEAALKEASTACATAQQQIMADGQIVQSSAQEQEQLLREMPDLLSVLEEARAQTQQRLSVIEGLRGTATIELEPSELESIQNEVVEKERTVAVEQQLATKLTRGSQAAATQCSARSDELHHLRQQIDVIERVATMKQFNSQKQASISSARDGILPEHRSEVTALRKTLMEEDKLFQRRHLDATAMRDARKTELARELHQLEVERESLRATLAQSGPLQCEPAERAAGTAPACHEAAYGRNEVAVTAGGSPFGVYQVEVAAAPCPTQEKRPGTKKKMDTSQKQQQGKAAKMRIARK